MLCKNCGAENFSENSFCKICINKLVRTGCKITQENTCNMNEEYISSNFKYERISSSRITNEKLELYTRGRKILLYGQMD